MFSPVRRALNVAASAKLKLPGAGRVQNHQDCPRTRRGLPPGAAIAELTLTVTSSPENNGRDGWNCADLPPAEGETPVGRTFIKQHCRKAVEGAIADIETHFFRKKGQYQYDPQTGRATEGQFESIVRFELTRM